MLERFEKVFEPVLDSANFWWMDFPVALAYGLVLLVFVGLSVFFGFHVWMTTNALTSIERSEKSSSSNPEVLHRFRISRIKYDQGWYQNWLHVMGPPHMWLIPVDPNPLDNGTYSEPQMFDTIKQR